MENYPACKEIITRHLGSNTFECPSISATTPRLKTKHDVYIPHITMSYIFGEEEVIETAHCLMSLPWVGYPVQLTVPGANSQQ